MTHLLLSRRAGAVEVVELSGADEPVATSTVSHDDLPGWVRGRETAHPRWTWDDTARWYPALLRAGVRVQRCWDLRLGHDLLRRSPLTRSVAPHPGSARWDALGPATDVGDTLFDGDGVDGSLAVVAEHRWQRAALAGCPEPGRLALLATAESSAALVATEMTHAGLPWDAAVHRELLLQLFGPRPLTGQRPAVLERLVAEVREAFAAPSLNPDSPGPLLQALRAAGLTVDDTRTWTLERLQHPGLPALLEYKRLARLLSTNGWAWLDTWVHDDRFRPEYLPGGVVTGRWASRGGGALTVPAPLRPAVRSDPGWQLVVADAAQLEPRVLAGLGGDLTMAGAGRGTDLYEGMVATGAVATRSEAKLGMLGAMYGGTSGESGRMVTRMTRRYPAAFGYVEEAARAGERGEVVRTLLGRGSPAPSGAWTLAATELPREAGTHDRDRRSWGRFTRNFVVQGTAAEWALCWLALLRNKLWQLAPDGLLTERPHLVMFLHDEVLVHCPEPLVTEVELAVRDAAAEAGRLLFGSFPVDFPLQVSVVSSWAQAR